MMPRLQKKEYHRNKRKKRRKRKRRQLRSPPLTISFDSRKRSTDRRPSSGKLSRSNVNYRSRKSSYGDRRRSSA